MGFRSESSIFPPGHILNSLMSCNREQSLGTLQYSCSTLQTGGRPWTIYSFTSATTNRKVAKEAEKLRKSTSMTSPGTNTARALTWNHLRIHSVDGLQQVRRVQRSRRTHCDEEAYWFVLRERAHDPVDDWATTNRPVAMDTSSQYMKRASWKESPHTVLK